MRDNQRRVCYTKRKRKLTFISQFLLLDLWWMQCFERAYPYSLYPKPTATTAGQWIIFTFTEFSAYLGLPVIYKGTQSSKWVSIGYTNQSTTPLWAGYRHVNCDYRADRSICTIGTYWTKIRPAARYCTGSELQRRIAACVTNTGRYRQLQTEQFKASSQYPLEHDGLKCCYQGTHLDIQTSSLSSYSRAFRWQHCLRRATCGIDSCQPDLSVLSQHRLKPHCSALRGRSVICSSTRFITWTHFRVLRRLQEDGWALILTHNEAGGQSRSMAGWAQWKPQWATGNVPELGIHQTKSSCFDTLLYFKVENKILRMPEQKLSKMHF